MLHANRQQTGGSILGVTLTAVVHAVAIYAVMTGLARKAVDVIRGPLEAEIIEEVPPLDDGAPPPPIPVLKDQKIPLAPPWDPGFTVATGPGTITQQPADPVILRPSAPPEPVRVAPRADPRRPNVQPDYPATSQRLGEEGTVLLNLLVGADGRVKDANVAATSGFSRLDEAALKEARRSYRFLPGTEDGKPADSWHRIKVTFRIVDAR